MKRWDQDEDDSINDIHVNNDKNNNDKQKTNYAKGMLGFFLGVVAAPFVAAGTLLTTAGLSGVAGFTSGLHAVAKRTRKIGRVGVLLGGVAGILTGSVTMALGIVTGTLLAVYTGVLTPFVAAQMGSENKKISSFFNEKVFSVLKKAANLFISSIKKNFDKALNPQRMPSPRPVFGIDESDNLQINDDKDLDDLDKRYREGSDPGKLPKFTETGYKPRKTSTEKEAVSNKTATVVVLGNVEAEKTKAPVVVLGSVEAEKPPITPQEQLRKDKFKKSKKPQNEEPYDPDKDKPEPPFL